VDAAAAEQEQLIAEALSMKEDGYEPVQGGEVPFDPPCDCGGEKAGTTHSTWCGRYR
jgi:hypothetical protein